MKLHEKIAWYRRRAKLSQEELAARVGVSRQAVSKWELGESTPEVSKLLALARAFGVTTDQLLSEEDPAPAPEPAPEPTPEPTPEGGLPPAFGFLGRMVRRWGWLAGIYLALSGLSTALVGALARFAFGRMFQVTVGDRFSDMGWDVGGFPAELEGYFDISTGVSSMGSVFLTIATVILVLGLATALAGIVLALVLKRRGGK